MDDSGHDIDPLQARNEVELSLCLKKLWIHAGEPPSRVIEKDTNEKGGKLPGTSLSRVRIGRTNLSLVLNGKFPTKPFLLTFVEYCDVNLLEDPRWAEAWDRIQLRRRNLDRNENPPSTDKNPTLPPIAPIRTDIKLRSDDLQDHEQASTISSLGTAEGPHAVDVAIVSCDIVRHSRMNRSSQTHNVDSINKIVAKTLGAVTDGDIAWASGGDGGHVVLVGDMWQEPAIQLLADLREWAKVADAPLRITAHFGSVDRITGADGRHQFVGPGINFAAWIVNTGSPECIVVSDAFRLAYEHSPADLEVTFHDMRILRDKNMEPAQLWLMSFEQTQSHWGLPVDEDQEGLKRALSTSDSWSAMYFTKRIMQINSNDTKAIDAIHRIAESGLMYEDPHRGKTSNPFLGKLPGRTLKELVQLGELIERDAYEVICRFGDHGDTMFVILHGQVGVYNSEGQGSANPSEPAHVMNEGNIVGELAVTLGRSRTADLVTLTKTSLLSFDIQEIYRRLPKDDPTLTAIQEFIDSRTLEHLCDNAPYFDEALTAGSGSKAEAVSNLAYASHSLTLNPPDLVITFELVEPINGGNGLYILISGVLSGLDFEGLLQPDKFPILWARLPGVPVQVERQYKIEDGQVKIFHINSDALGERLETAKRARLYDVLRTYNPFSK
ncbi:cyclic nucleotide-binding domain-containing protein [Amycolatopsis sp. RTGN1]|uniref:cyclic nucleotide-binding domain-containing protein n=1 Tax=Amycolatopsis ponsaeliensis TaxID=2992142 RepID=UPI00254DD17C|nr:cyclic nucleotide-binding domain-containing protein [Amycolatopsis sp. RTGN1]